MGLGDFLSGVLGTNSQVGVGPQQGLNQWNYTPEVNQGLANFRSADAGQEGLAKQLLAQSQGGGPNPAAAMLQAGQNQAAAQSLGAYANNRAINPALAARQASMVSAQTGQEAANQASMMRAQQQLAAQGQLGQLQGQRAQQGLGLYGTAQQGNAQQNNAINSANAINAGVASGNQQAAEGIIGGILGAGGAALGKAKAHGGMIGHYADGGDVGISTSADRQANAANAFSAFGKSMTGAAGPQSNVGRFLAMSASPGMAPMARGGNVGTALKSGGHVPGKAKVGGDSFKNDNVSALLSPDEIVIPRSITLSANAPEKAKAFVAAILARQNLGKKK